LAAVRQELNMLKTSKAFYLKFANDMEPLQKASLNEKHRLCDMICLFKLESGEHVLVEAQVMHDCVRDHRFLAYAATLSENQLRIIRGDPEWKSAPYNKLTAVYFVNVMASGILTQLLKANSTSGEYPRHDRMTDLSIEIKPILLHQLHRIPISLHDLDLEKGGRRLCRQQR
jgi:hypothetical protein